MIVNREWKLLRTASSHQKNFVMFSIVVFHGEYGMVPGSVAITSNGEFFIFIEGFITLFPKEIIGDGRKKDKNFTYPNPLSSYHLSSLHLPIKPPTGLFPKMAPLKTIRHRESDSHFPNEKSLPSDDFIFSLLF